MGGMRLWARVELRRRWRSLVALIVLAGLPAGVAIAAANGASRTDTAIDRLVATTKPAEISWITYFQTTKVAFKDIARLPVVSEAVLFHGYSILLPEPQDFSHREIEELESLVGDGFDLTNIGDELDRATGGRRTRIFAALVTILRRRDDPEFAFEHARDRPVTELTAEVARIFGVMVDIQIGAPVGKEFPPGRTHLLEGRTARPGSIDEAVINYRAAERYRWKVGDVVPFRLAGLGTDFFGGETKAGPPQLVRATIVGISANPGDFVGSAGPEITFGPSFARTYDPRAASLDVYTFSLVHGAADVPTFDEDIRTLTGGGGVIHVDSRSGIAQVRRLFRVQGAALWVLSLSLGLVTALIFTQSFARQTIAQSGEYGILRALGVTRRDLSLFSVARAGAVALAAAVLAAIVAAGLSPLAPLGTARLAEPHPGLSLPATTFVGGVGVALALVFLFALAPSLLAARAATGMGSTSPQRPSAVTRLVGLITRRPAPAVGARFAFESGRGATAVPVRTSLTASITGIVALLAALIVGSSLQHLLVTPSLYGWNWDLTLPGEFAPGSRDLGDLTKDPAVADVSVGTAGEGAVFQVGRKDASATIYGVEVDRVKGKLEPTLLSGRVPDDDGEIALGTKTMQAVQARLGSVVPVNLVGTESSTNFRVVGEVVLPFDDAITGVGEGLWITATAMAKLIHAAPSDVAIVRLNPGVDRPAAISRLAKRFPGDALTLVVPRTIKSFGRMSNLPVAFAAMLAALAAGTLAHMLTASIRRRRRDLAILKTIGFSRGQVRSAVGWQAAVFVSVALAISVPLGIIVGRWAWNLIARYGGFAGEPAVPALQILVVAFSALAAAVLLATLPARAAARTPPALVLRTE